MHFKKNIPLMFAIVFLQGFVFYGPIATLYRESRGITLSQIFLIESISWLLMIALEVPWGWFADRFGYKKTLLFVNGLFFVSKIVFYSAHSFSGFLIERILLSFVFAGLSGCDTALLYSSSSEASRDKIFSYYSAIGTAGFLATSILSTLIIQSPLNAAVIDRTGLYTIFPYALAFALSFFLAEVPKSPHERPKLLQSIGRAVKNPGVIGIVVAVSLSREIYQSVTVFLNQAQYIKSGIDVRWFGLLLVFMQLGKLLAVKAHWLTERFSARKAVLAMLLLITASTWVLYKTNSPVGSVLGILCISIGMAVLEPIAIVLENRSLIDADRATVLSVYAVLGEIMAAGINPLIGQAADNSLGTALLLCTGIGCMAIFIFIWSGRKDKRINAIPPTAQSE